MNRFEKNFLNAVDYSVFGNLGESNETHQAINIINDNGEVYAFACDNRYLTLYMGNKVLRIPSSACIALAATLSAEYNKF